MTEEINQNIKVHVDLTLNAIQLALLEPDPQSMKTLTIDMLKSMTQEEIDKRIAILTPLSIKEIEDIINFIIGVEFNSLLDKKQQRKFCKELSRELHPDKIGTRQLVLWKIIKARNPEAMGVPQKILNELNSSISLNFFTNTKDLGTQAFEVQKQVINHIESKLDKYFFPLNKILIFFYTVVNAIVLVANIVMAITLVVVPALFLLALPRMIMNLVCNFISDGHLNKVSEYDKSASVFLLFARAMGRALTSWPESWLGRGLHLIFVKPIQVVVTPVLLGIAACLDLIQVASFIPLIVGIIPNIVALTLGAVLAAPVYFVEAVQGLISCLKSCFKKKEPPPGEKVPSDIPTGSNAAEALPRNSISTLLAPEVDTQIPGHYGEPVNFRGASTTNNNISTEHVVSDLERANALANAMD